MSWLQVGCPRCPMMLNVPAQMAGQMVVCPACGLSYQVPQAATAPPPVWNAAPQWTAPPPPQHYAPQPPAAPGFAAIPYGAPPPIYGAPQGAPAPGFEYPPLLPTGSGATAPQVSAPAAAPPPAHPPASPALPPVEVLSAPKSSSHGEQPRPKWQHEKRSQLASARRPQAEEAPTANLPPAVVRGMRDLAAPPPTAADAEFPRSSASVLRPPHEPAPPAVEDKRHDSAAHDQRKFPGAAPTMPIANSGSREELNVVEERLRRERQRTRTTLYVALFGIGAMVLFAWFVVNLSRPQ